MAINLRLDPMPSLQHQLIKLSANNIGRALNKDITQIQSLRRLLDMSALPLNMPRGVKTKAIKIGKIAAEWYYPRQADMTKVILFVHGGGYAVGSIQTHRALAARIAQASHCVAISVDYRLVPEHPFPAALEDVVHAYEWLILKGYNPQDIAMTGDSAGGGLIMSTLITLRQMNSPQPAAVALMCPWVDLSFAGDSASENQAFDPIVSVNQVRDWGIVYAGKYTIYHPMISPLNASLNDLSPMLIQASTKEVLTDDAIGLEKKIRQDGGEVELQLYDGLLHVWHLFWKYVPEAQQAIDKMADFFQQAFQEREEENSSSTIRKAS